MVQAHQTIIYYLKNIVVLLHSTYHPVKQLFIKLIIQLINILLLKHTITVCARDHQRIFGVLVQIIVFYFYGAAVVLKENEWRIDFCYLYYHFYVSLGDYRAVARDVHEVVRVCGWVGMKNNEMDGRGVLIGNSQDCELGWDECAMLVIWGISRGVCAGNMACDGQHDAYYHIRYKVSS